ncbi:hypothetical protein GCM10020331_026360 [Ectobacillus funiculus]
MTVEIAIPAAQLNQESSGGGGGGGGSTMIRTGQGVTIAEALEDLKEKNSAKSLLGSFRSDCDW